MSAEVELCLRLLGTNSKKRSCGLNMSAVMDLPQQIAVVRRVPEYVTREHQCWGVVGALLKQLNVRDPAVKAEAETVAYWATGTNRIIIKKYYRSIDEVDQAENETKERLRNFLDGAGIRDELGMLTPLPRPRPIEKRPEPAATLPLAHLGGLPIW